MLEAESERLHLEGLTELQKSLARHLYRVKAIKFGEFRVKSHMDFPDMPLSPIYINLRPSFRRFTDVKEVILIALEEKVRQIKPDLLADVPTSSTPLVSSLSDKTNIPMISPRIEGKDYGLNDSIDGALEFDKGKTVLLIDDLILDGGSKKKAVGILRNFGLVVKDVLVVFNRQQGGEEELEEIGIKLHSVLNMDPTLDYYVSHRIILEEDKQRIIDGLQNMENHRKLVSRVE